MMGKSCAEGRRKARCHDSEHQAGPASGRTIGARIVARAVQKASRGGYRHHGPRTRLFSRSMTMRIGRHAMRLFSEGIVVESVVRNGQTAG
jgi:hypothetical protein